MPEKVKKLSKKIIALVCMGTLVFSFLLITENAEATLASVKDTLSDSRFGTASDHTIAFTIKAGALTDSDTIQVAFEADFNVASVVFADIDIADDSDDYTLDEGACVDDELGVTGIGTSTITFTLCTGTTIADEEPITIEIGSVAGGTAHITNPATATCGTGDDSNVCSVTVTTSDESGAARVAMLAGVGVTGTVEEYLTFSCDDYAVGFGTWTGGATDDTWATKNAAGDTSSNSSPFQLTVSSNGGGGVSVTARSTGDGTTNAGLYCSSTTELIEADNANDIADGTEGYALYTSSGTTLTENTFADETATGIISTSNQEIASASGVVSSGIVEVALYAAIAATTPAGTYTDTLVFIATPTY